MATLHIYSLHLFSISVIGILTQPANIMAPVVQKTVSTAQLPHGFSNLACSDRLRGDVQMQLVGWRGMRAFRHVKIVVEPC